MTPNPNITRRQGLAHRMIRRLYYAWLRWRYPTEPMDWPSQGWRLALNCPIVAGMDSRRFRYYYVVLPHPLSSSTPIGWTLALNRPFYYVVLPHEQPSASAGAA